MRGRAKHLEVEVEVEAERCVTPCRRCRCNKKCAIDRQRLREAIAEGLGVIEESETAANPSLRILNLAKLDVESVTLGS
eukprot:557-Heterococcus_DN1.PRE.1